MNRRPLSQARMVSLTVHEDQVQVELPDGSLILIQPLFVAGTLLRLHLHTPAGSIVATQQLPPKRNALPINTHSPRNRSSHS